MNLDLLFFSFADKVSPHLGLISTEDKFAFRTNAQNIVTDQYCS